MGIVNNSSIMLRLIDSQTQICLEDYLRGNIEAARNRAIRLWDLIDIADNPEPMWDYMFDLLPVGMGGNLDYYEK